MRLPQEKRLSNESLLARTEARLIKESARNSKNKSTPPPTSSPTTDEEHDAVARDDDLGSISVTSKTSQADDDVGDSMRTPCDDDVTAPENTSVGQTDDDVSLNSSGLQESFPPEFDVLFQDEEFKDKI